MRRQFVGRTELILFGVGVLVLVGAAAMPRDIAVVPECMVLWNVVKLFSFAVVVVVVARQAWLWFGWWSVALVPACLWWSFPWR